MTAAWVNVLAVVLPLVVLCCAARCRCVTLERGLGASSIVRRRWVPVLVVVFGVGLAALSLLRHQALHTHGCDLGIFENVLWNTVHGEGFFSTILDRPFMGEHASPILLLLAPLYALWSSPRLLLVVQAVALAWAALPIHRMAARRLGTTGGLLVLFLYFFYVPLQGVYLFDFHEIALAIPLLAYAAAALFRGRFKRMALYLLAALLCKEELALSVAAFGLVLLLFPRSAGALPREASTAGRRQWGFLLMLSGGVLFLFLTGWVVPGFRQAPFPYVDRYSHLGGSLPGIAWTGLTQPALVWKSITEPDKLEFLNGLFLPVLYLNWLSPSTVLLMLPTLARSLLSNHLPQFSLDFHFLGSLVPFVFIGLAGGIRHVLQWGRRTGRPVAGIRMVRRTCFRMLLTALFLSGIVFGSRPGTLWKKSRLNLDRRADLVRLLDEIPEDAAVCAHNSLVAQVAGRGQITVFPDLRDARFVLLDFNSCHREYPVCREEHVRHLLRLLKSDDWQIRDMAGKFILLERGNGEEGLSAEEGLRRLFLEYSPVDLVEIPARRDPISRKRYPQILHAADWLFPAGEYRVRFHYRADRPVPEDARVGFLIHPRWGEFSGDWALASRVLTGNELESANRTEQTIELAFTTEQPAMLGLQISGAEAAGIEVTGMELEPQLPLDGFTTNLIQLYEKTVVE